MRRSAAYSALLHLAVLLIASFGLPQLMQPPIILDQPLVVEVLPIAEKTNVPPPKPAQPTPEPPKPEPPKPEPPKPEPPKPEPPPPPPRPRPPAPEPPPKQREQAFDLDAVLKDLTKRQPQAKAPPPAPPAPQQMASRSSSNAPSNPTQPLTMSEQDAIRQHVERFWNPPVGARDAQDLVVEVRVWVDPDGTVRDVRIIDQGRVARDEFYRAAAESAERAVRRASPLPVPRDKYDQFKVMVLGFSPREMLGIRG